MKNQSAIVCAKASRQSASRYGIVSVLETCLKLWSCVLGIDVRGFATL
jgi:hypothetical protein